MKQGVRPAGKLHRSPRRQSLDIWRNTCARLHGHSSLPPPDLWHTRRPHVCTCHIYAHVHRVSPCLHTCAHTIRTPCAHTRHTVHTQSRHFPDIRARVSLPCTDVISVTPQCSPLSGGGGFTRSRPFLTHASGERGLQTLPNAHLGGEGRFSVPQSQRSVSEHKEPCFQGFL